jgi:O-antigen/teichoic acid export membrane protein
VAEPARRLRGDFTLAVLQNIAVVGVAVATSVMIARTLGPDGNGNYAIAVLLPTLLMVFTNLGVSPANAYFIASGRVSFDVALRTSFRLWIGLSAVGMAVAFAIILFGARLFPGVPAQWLALALLAFPAALLGAFLVSLLHGLADFPRYYAGVLAAPAFILVFVTLFVLIFRWGALGAIMGFVAGQLAGAGTVLLLLQTHRRKPEEVTAGESWSVYARRCLDFGWRAHLSNVLTFLNYRADLFLVNLLMSPAAAGIYLVAVQIAERLWITSSSASEVILPRLARSYARDSQTTTLTPIVARWVFAASVLGAAVLAAAGHLLILLLFGEKYLSAEVALLWLLPGVAAASLRRIVASDVAARGKPELNLVTAAVVVAVNIVLNILLIPIQGIAGAALASTVANTVGAVMQVVIYARLGTAPWWRLVVWERGDWRLLRDLWPW